MDFVPQRTQRIIAVLIVIIAAAGLGIGLLQAPISAWSFIEIMDALILALLIVVGIYYAIKGRIYRSRVDLRRQRTWGWVAIVAFSVLMIVLIVSDLTTWGVIDTFAIATWTIVLVLFVPQVFFLNKAIAESESASGA